MRLNQLREKHPAVTNCLKKSLGVVSDINMLFFDVFYLTLQDIFDKYPHLNSFRVIQREYIVEGDKVRVPVISEFDWNNQRGRSHASLLHAQQKIRGMISAHAHPALNAFLSNRKFCRDLSSAKT